MTARPRLLLVEDNLMNARLMIGGLEDAYAVTHVETGESALDWLAGELPDLILLDVILPGEDGYTVCRRLREDSRTADIPVIFVSAMDGMEDRLNGYAAGGDDFLVKPVAFAELKQKVSVVLRYAENKRDLKQNVDSAFRTAMTAMSSAAELGILLHFFRESFGADSYAALGRNILSVLAQLGLDGSLQIRSRFGTHNLSADGFCSPLEASILGNVRSAGRLVDLGPRTAINYDRITIIVHNMPREDAERYGRLRDVLAQLAEGVDARVRALDDEASLRKRNLALSELATSAQAVRADLDYHLKQLDIRHTMQLRRLIGDVSESMVFLGLGQREAGVLRQVLETANRQIEEVGDLHGAIQADIDRLMTAIRLLADSEPAVKA